MWPAAWGALEHPRQSVVGGPDLGVEPLAERGERDPAAGAVDKLAAELVFELAQDLADAGRGQEEPFRTAAEVQLLGQGEEDAQLMQLDRLPHREAMLPAALRDRHLIPGRIGRYRSG